MKIYYGEMPKLTEKDKSGYSRNGYNCVALFRTKKGLPVIVSSCDSKLRRTIWKVEYGYSCIVFKTYDEAMEFCESRFPGLKEQAV